MVSKCLEGVHACCPLLPFRHAPTTVGGASSRRYSVPDFPEPVFPDCPVERVNLANEMHEGAPPKRANEKQRILYDAVWDGDELKTIDLLDDGVDPNIMCGPKGYAPLHVAAKLGSVRLCQILVRYKANIEVRTTYSKDTPLLCAIQAKQLSTTVFFARGADCNSRRQDGLSCHDVAINLGLQDIAAGLILHGAVV
eukprot:GEMP01057225.1.p1 GENE.GEMP01057225.1~~GEMP01057225.1.p1  ORF type:complete len:196 (+),score=37.51 GEMP01057225.1:72-659(+)